MSDLIVEVVEVADVLPHPHADRLEILVLKGWKVVAQKDFLKKGEKCVYFPPDSVMSDELADRLGIRKYLGMLPKNLDGTRDPGNRVMAAVLRGQPSYGTIMECENPDWLVGHNVKEHYGITKFVPPGLELDPEAEAPHPAFHRYTSIQSVGNYPGLIQVGEEVTYTEKLHGQNCRLGLIEGQFLVGSHHSQKRSDVNSYFWCMLTETIKTLLETLSANDGGKPHNVIIFGELIGPGVSDMAYGTEEKTFRAFDLSIDQKYVSFDEKLAIFAGCGIPTVPILYRGPFSVDSMEQYTLGPTTVCEPDQAGKFKGREGIVITPTTERLDFDLGGDGRVILKSVSADYFCRKGAKDTQ